MHNNLRGDIVFIDIFLHLCEENNVKPTRVANEIGSSSASVVKWKKGAIPQGPTLQKIAEYFNVTVDYLLTGEEPATPNFEAEKEKASAQLDAEEEELNEYLNELKNNPGMRVLFSKTKNAKKEDIEKVIKMLDIMRGDDDDGGYY